MIADDHALLRDMFGLYLGRDERFDVTSADGLESARRHVKLAAQSAFDLVLLDVYMPGMDGLSGLTEMLKLPGARRVAVMSGQAPPDLPGRALDLGAAGFLPKSMPAEEFEQAVTRMIEGEIVTDHVDPSQDANGAVAFRLSPREMQVLGLLTQGWTNKEIARALDIREPTVKLHVKTTYRKMGATNRTHAARIAREHGLF